MRRTARSRDPTNRGLRDERNVGQNAARSRLGHYAIRATTGVAALLEGRSFLGVEVAGEYARIAIDRLGATESQVQLADYRAGQQPLFPRSQVVGS